MSRDSTAVVWDLDSTLASTEQRQPMIEKIEAGELTWDDYSMACEMDEPIAGSIALMRLLRPYHQQIVLSGRSVASQPLTNDWLFRHDVPVDRLLLRHPSEPLGDEHKVEKIYRIIGSGIRVVLAVEDWKGTAERITREFGIPVLGVNPFYGEQVPHSQALRGLTP
jgi:hypothetical protein